VISLTESAARRIKEIISQKPEGLKPIGIRAAVQGGGCSGFKYVLDFVLVSNADDIENESNGVSIFSDRKSYLYLMGTVIDFVSDLGQTGFKFENPSAKRTCGCGESFGI